MDWLDPARLNSLFNLSQAEWSALCDGCGICCLYKVRTAAQPAGQLTRVACRYLDLEACTCQVYDQRHDLMPTCLQLTPENVPELAWLPETCAYRRLAEGKPLPWWHYLRSGKRDLVHRLGVSVRGCAVQEKDVDLDNLTRYIMDSW